MNRIDKGCVVPDPLTVPVHDLCMPNSKAPAETAQQTVLKITHLEIKRALRQAAYVRGIARSMNMHSLFPTQQGSAVMTGLFEKKWRCISRTVTYVGWSLFWLLLWDLAVTMDVMLIEGKGIDFPLMPLTLLCSALIVLISFRNTSA
ncbi:Conserved effector locus protein [Pseudomonas savastanoi pv. glycinea]|nr:Conserved effector locus protein [Pseudomonas savastanoi pv. glycinea]